MAAVNTKGSAVITRVALPAALENIAAQVAGALHETTSLSETLGTLTRDAGKLIKKTPDMLDPFVDACRQMCAAHGLTEGSFKVYMSNIRGVIRAMVVNGYNPKDGQSLRVMYDKAPKGNGANAGGGKKTGARHDTDKAAASGDAALSDADDSDNASVPVAAKPADVKRAAIVALFGHCDDELMAALAWAATNEQSFIRYVKANLTASKAPALKKAA